MSYAVRPSTDTWRGARVCEKTLTTNGACATSRTASAAAVSNAGVPARGLNGEAYRGHVFWDELFVFPFLNFRMPEASGSTTRLSPTYTYEATSNIRNGSAFPHTA